MPYRSLPKKLTKLIALLLISLMTVYFRQHQPNLSPNKTVTVPDNSGFTDPAVISKAFAYQRSNFQVKQTGQIIKVLGDDNYGPRHQRFLVQLADGQKLLIAHNIDLATKIDNLTAGEAISFYGEYEWNNKGGVIHWTHLDPKGRHPNGWILYNNRRYE